MKKIFNKLTLLVTLFIIFSVTSISTIGQTTLSTGDIAFTGYVSSDPSMSDRFSFVLLKELEANTTIFFTDRGWRLDQNAFDVNTESLIAFVSANTIPIGKEIMIVTGATTATFPDGSLAGYLSVTGVPLSLSNTGDQLFAFQGSLLNPTFITGIHMNVTSNTDAGGWDNFATVNTNTSDKPYALTTGVNAIWIGTPGVTSSEKDNARFNCSGNLTYYVRDVQFAIYYGGSSTNPTFTNWTTSDATAGFTMPSNCSFLTKPTPLITLNPFQQTVCSGAVASFTVYAQQASGFGWLKAVSPYTQYFGVSGGVYSQMDGKDSSTFIISNTEGLDGVKFKCAVFGPGLPPQEIAFSNPALLTVNSNTLITSQPVNKAICSGGLATFSTTASGTNVSYKWLVDTGDGFHTINNDNIFTNATTNTLIVNNPTSIFNGAIFKAIATGNCGADTSSTAMLTFSASGSSTWIGGVDNTWETAGNWSCGLLPDANTDVIIPPSSIVTVNSDATCRTLTVMDGANFTVSGGFKLTVLH